MSLEKWGWKVGGGGGDMCDVSVFFFLLFFGPFSSIHGVCLPLKWKPQYVREMQHFLRTYTYSHTNTRGYIIYV